MKPVPPTPNVCIGTNRDAVVPSPNCPALLKPQQKTVPSVLRLQRKSLPARTWAALPIDDKATEAALPMPVTNVFWFVPVLKSTSVVCVTEAV